MGLHDAYLLRVYLEFSFFLVVLVLEGQNRTVPVTAELPHEKLLAGVRDLLAANSFVFLLLQRLEESGCPGHMRFPASLQALISHH